jgi:hypothetical protein
MCSLDSAALKSWVGGGEEDGVSWASPTMGGDWGENGDGVGRDDRTSLAPGPKMHMYTFIV